MPHLPRPLAIITLLLWAGTALAGTPTPSFNCADAKSLTEQAICADPALAAMDADIARLYKQALAKAGRDAEAIRAEERRWLAYRNQSCDKTSTPPLPEDWVRKETQACLAKTLPFRRAALSVLADGTPFAPFCQRVAATLGAARMPDGAPPGDNLSDQAIKAGLVHAATDNQELTPVWNRRLAPYLNKITNGQIDLHRFGTPPAYMVLSTVGGSMSCQYFDWFKLNGPDAVAPLPPPEKADESSYCLNAGALSTSATAGEISTGVTGTAAFIVSENQITAATLRTHSLVNGAWTDSCQVAAEYSTTYEVTEGGCTADTALCDALKGQLAGWAAMVEKSGWSQDASGPGAHKTFPALPGVVAGGLPPTGTLELVPDMAQASWPLFVTEAPLLTWRGPGKSLTLRLSHATLGWREDTTYILGAWRNVGDTLTPVAGYVIALKRTGVPVVKVTPQP
ncbi:lysozyme inhibitor LprI family protein [Nitrospirillum sp. BR 11828]|uniref:lysozyme inhibitor LprI family protein n=1 Tax=Nitrospirillum sp. BR 11828 TaxID=3104325 RepID=UPI002ACA8430|nr:lysozyme inhibitor LprI family protein [Nitrospirillum sp. BR 11828]MDZ5648801.1 lysozyme inhibitor LprI family protein [Nitrospirillum sp. BR 11828]